ncbi:MAG: response regulator transcription factor [Proteobacteria bacterium]|nr:response regulator transcription factor [Pseudomonadota bacterium]
MTAPATTVLIVDDDQGVIEVLKPALSDSGYAVRTAKTVDRAFAFLNDEEIALILLDLDLPGLSGFELLKILRASPRLEHTPVLMMTVHGKEPEKIAGLKHGADDYMVKPFSVGELLARVEALLRRARHGGKLSRVFESKGIRVDLDAREVSVKNERVDLTSTEFDLLVRLIERRGMVLSYRSLSESMSADSKMVGPDNVQWHIRNLRRKLGVAGEQIETVHGIGFKFAGA